MTCKTLRALGYKQIQAHSTECCVHSRGDTNPTYIQSRGAQIITVNQNQATYIPQGFWAKNRSKAQPVHNLAAMEQPTLKLGDVISCKRYSSEFKLLRVTATLAKQGKFSSLQNGIAVTELADLVGHWAQKLAQEERFTLWKKQFDVFLDGKGECQALLWILTLHMWQSMIGQVKLTLLHGAIVQIELIINLTPLSHLLASNLEEQMT